MWNSTDSCVCLCWTLVLYLVYIWHVCITVACIIAIYCPETFSYFHDIDKHITVVFVYSGYYYYPCLFSNILVKNVCVCEVANHYISARYNTIKLEIIYEVIFLYIRGKTNYISPMGIYIYIYIYIHTHTRIYL